MLVEEVFAATIQKTGTNSTLFQIIVISGIYLFGVEFLLKKKTDFKPYLMCNRSTKRHCEFNYYFNVSIIHWI